jgi:hypothetical protein
MPKLPLQLDDYVEDVVRDYPEAVTFLRRWNIVCVQCGEPVWGTLREVIEEKHQDVHQVLVRLNEFLEKQSD